jgi:hypothetical protein
VRIEDRPCKHRGPEIGWIECGCGGNPLLYACGSPDVAEDYCLLHAAGKPMGTLFFRDNMREQRVRKKLKEIPVCAVCKYGDE